MDEQQLLRNPDIAPTSEVIAEALGSANAEYVKFMDGLPHHDVEVAWRYYNDGKAWLGKGLYQRTGARGGQKEITVFWLSIWDGFFKVTFYIPEKARAEALSLSIDEGVNHTIAAAKPLGKLKFFPLTFDLKSDESFDDLYTLVNFRKMLK